MYIPLDCAQVNFIFGGTACPEGAQCVFGIDHSAFVAAKSTIPDVIKTNWDDAGSLRSVTSSRVVLEKIRVKLGPNSTGAFYEIGVNQAGDLDRAHANPNTAALISKITELGGRAGRGRTFWPGVSENDEDEAGVLSPARVTELQAGFDSFQLKMFTDNLLLVVLHEEVIPAPTPITNFVVQSRTATQRRRLRRT